MLVDFLATERHYGGHLLGIWDALPPEHRGTFWATENRGAAQWLRERGVGVADPVLPLGPGPPTVVAAISDAQQVHRPLALVEHGAGQTYGQGMNPGYAGGLRRERVGLFVCPSQRVADLNLARYPQAQAVAVGCPYLDRWLPAKPWVCPSEPTVAISFHAHLDGREHDGFARNAWGFYVTHLSELSSRWETLGHGHPRFWSPDLEATYEANGIEPVREWAEVIDRAHLYIVDNSSTGFEWAALGRPLVWMNCRHYRKDIEIGLRFWDTVDVGWQCDKPEHLADVAQTALDEFSGPSPLIDDVYAYRDGRSAQRAADAIAGWASLRP